MFASVEVPHKFKKGVSLKTRLKTFCQGQILFLFFEMTGIFAVLPCVLKPLEFTDIKLN